MKKAQQKGWGGRHHYHQAIAHTDPLHYLPMHCGMRAVVTSEKWWATPNQNDFLQIHQMVSHPLQALHPKTLISILLTNHSSLEISTTRQEIQL